MHNIIWIKAFVGPVRNIHSLQFGMTMKWQTIRILKEPKIIKTQKVILTYEKRLPNKLITNGFQSGKERNITEIFLLGTSLILSCLMNGWRAAQNNLKVFWMLHIVIRPEACSVESNFYG